MQSRSPELRFSEFSSRWNSFVLGNIATFSKGKGISKSDIDETGDVECIRYGELYTVYSEIINEVISKTNIDRDKLVLSEVNDVIIPASGESQIDIATASCIVKKGIAIGGDLNIIRTNVNGVFLAYYLNNTRKKAIARLSQGISVIHLYSKQLSKLQVSIPAMEEQKKVASFFISIDKRIQLLNQKRNNLELYKKGVMQQLFLQEIRFKQDDGSEFQDWEEKKAKQVFKNHSNKNHNGDLPILSASQEFGMIYREDSGIKIQSSAKSVKSYKIVEPNDFVISLRSFQGGIDFSDKLGICSPAYIVLKNKIPIDYLFYKFYFKKDRFIRRLSNTTVGIRDGKQITYENFGALDIVYPSVPEQKKIASFLSSIDSSIQKVEAQIEGMNQFKKGLLQQMFV